MLVPCSTRLTKHVSPHLHFRLLKLIPPEVPSISSASARSDLRFGFHSYYTIHKAHTVRMSRLLHLPDEMLLNIIKKILPDGITDLALCCKKLYNKSDMILEEFQLNRMIFTNIPWPLYVRSTFLPPKWVPEYFTNASCLSGLLQEPHLAMYVRHVAFYTNWTNRYFNDTKEDFERLFKDQSKPFPNSAVTTKDHIWQDFFNISRKKLDNGDIETVSALLLAHLPELRKLTLYNLSFDREVLTMLENIIKANELAVRCGKHPIALRKPEFIYDMIILEEAQNIGLFEAFATLPSMRDIRITCRRNRSITGPLKWSLSSTTRLDLVDGELRQDERILPRTKALEAFHYEAHATPLDRRVGRFDPPILVRLLER